MNLEWPLVNCRKPPLTILQNMLRGERDRMAPLMSCPTMDILFFGHSESHQGKETKEALKKPALGWGQEKGESSNHQSDGVTQSHREPPTAILIRSVKGLLSGFWKLFLIILDLLFEYFNLKAYPGFPRISRNRSTFFCCSILPHSSSQQTLRCWGYSNEHHGKTPMLSEPLF